MYSAICCSLYLKRNIVNFLYLLKSLWKLNSNPHTCKSIFTSTMNLRWTSPHPLFSGMVRYIDKTKYVTKNNRLSASLKKSPCLKIIDHFTNLEIYFLIAVFRNLKIWTMHYKHWCCWLLLIWLKMVFPAVKTSWFIAFPPQSRV